MSDLWELRTGHRQDVGVNARRATASLRSSRYMTLNGQPAAGERNAVMGVYPAKNGRWSYLHCNFPNHREAALSVLGVEEDKDAVRRAVAQWDARELEEAIIGARGAGGMVRTMQEWAAASSIGGGGVAAPAGDSQNRRRAAPALCPRATGRFQAFGHWT